MPANLTPQYLSAEKRYKEAQSDRERLEALKEMYALMPKHKGTDKLQADLKRRISQLRDDIQKGGKGSKQQFRYHVDSEGMPQIVLIGPTNVGKSQLLAALTHAHPEIADYPYTTRIYLPGVMNYLNYHIQIVDMPPISTDFMEFWVTEIIKHADAALLVVDLAAADPLSPVEEIQHLLKEKNIHLTRKEWPPDPYRQEHYLLTMIVGNKSDQKSAPENWQVLQELYGSEFLMCPVAAINGSNLEELKKMCVQFLNIIRVYSKPPGKPHSEEKPFIFKKGSTLLDFASAIHHDFSQNLKFARVWGSGKFQGQRINRDYKLMDEDIIELHI
jgi:hypothetical protein